MKIVFVVYTSDTGGCRLVVHYQQTDLVHSLVLLLLFLLVIQGISNARTIIVFSALAIVISDCWRFDPFCQ